MNFQQAVLKAGRVADFKFYLEMQRIKNNQSNLGKKKKKRTNRELNLTLRLIRIPLLKKSVFGERIDKLMEYR